MYYYVLSGKTNKKHKKRIYVGKTKNLAKRLNQHQNISNFGKRNKQIKLFYFEEINKDLLNSYENERLLKYLFNKRKVKMKI